MAAFLWSRSGMLRQVFEVVQVVRSWPGVMLRRDRNGLCLALGEVVLGHLRWDGRIELPFAPETANRLVTEDMVRFDPGHPGTDRVVFDIRSAADVDRAVWLLRLSYLSLDAKADVCGCDAVELGPEA
jgi:hypothetical protein